jgi:hypothetical protein
LTAVVLVSLYFLALTAFLGLDVLGKVPVSLVALVTAALGGTAAVVVVAAFALSGRTPAASGPTLALLAAGLGAAAAGAALTALGRLSGPWARKRPTP